MPTGINLVPNNTGSAGVGSTLGTEAKKWDNIYSTTGSIDFISSSAGSLYVSGDITASGGIKADSFQSVMGGTGIDFNDDLLVSGDISASGDVILESDKDLYFNGVSGYNRIYHDTGRGLRVYGDLGYGASIMTKTQIGTFNTSSAILTVAGDISASGEIYSAGASSSFGTNTPAVPGITVAGDISASGQYFKLSGSGHSSLQTLSVGQSTAATNMELTVEGDISASGVLWLEADKKIKWVNNSTFIQGDDTSIQIDGDSVVSLVAGSKVYISTPLVGIGNTNPTKTLTVSGSISASGNLYVDGQISASDGLTSFNTIHVKDGTINSPGDTLVRLGLWQTGDDGAVSIYRNGDVMHRFHANQHSFMSGSYGLSIGTAVSASGAKLTVAGNTTLSGDSAIGSSIVSTHTFLGNITASGASYGGNISASGTMTAAAFEGTTVGTHYGSVAAANDISASGGFHVSSSGLVAIGGNIDFDNLPSSPGSVSTGQLYTLSGSQLPFSGSTAEMNNISASKFVLIK